MKKKRKKVIIIIIHHNKTEKEVIKVFKVKNSNVTNIQTVKCQYTDSYQRYGHKEGGG